MKNLCEKKLLKECKLKSEIEAVIIVPSKELGMQIMREVDKLLRLENKKAVWGCKPIKTKRNSKEK